MHAVSPAYQAFIENTTNMELAGEIITWDLAYNTSVPYADLQAALKNEGLDEKALRRLLPRYAFARAAKKMEENRIIRFIGEAENKLAFQFTKEYKDTTAEQFNYDREAKLYLSKDTGDIAVMSEVLSFQETQQLADHAAQLLASAIENRTTADVTRVIKRLFEKNADLFPVRDAGSVYFVPNTHSEFVDRVQRFVTALNGRLRRFPVPAGTQHGNQSIKEAVNEGLERIIQDHLEAVESFGTDTRESTVNKALNRIEQTAFKIEAYKEFLEEQAQGLDSKLGSIRLQMRQKLADILTAKAEAANA